MFRGVRQWECGPDTRRVAEGRDLTYKQGIAPCHKDSRGLPLVLARFNHRARRIAACGLALFLAISLGTRRPAHAGGGPENVLLLVNASSESSKSVANHYIELRKIPPQNVLYINWRGGLHAIKAATFRDRILTPAIKWMEQRRITAQIDYIVYSSDFPTRIDLQEFFPDGSQPTRLNSAGSLTGLTYLAPYVINREPAVTASNVNWYVPGPRVQNLAACTQLANVPTRGFRAVYLWDETGARTTDPTKGQRYLLSTILGVTHGRGNTVAEIHSYLKRAADADGSRPKGTIYFVKNNNPRSQPRHACFDAIAADINKLGVRAVVESGTIPRNAKDVMGLMAGVETFDWSKSGSRILPGAICEHLTSYGGDMRSDAFQTPLSEFLRHGAAGASGTVKEPTAVQAKFPLPSLQLHYVRGASLAEAFYQSIASPFQLLVVGDPLCQPWAQFPTVTVQGIAANQEVRGSISITPAGAASRPLRMIDLILDGTLIARAAPGKAINLDTSKIADGHHELRVVGVDAGPIETQGRVIVPFTVNNHDTKLEVGVAPGATVGFDATLRLSVRQPGATAFSIQQNSRVLARVEGEAGTAEIAAATLGRGPTTLQAVSQGQHPAVSAPVRIVVK